MSRSGYNYILDELNIHISLDVYNEILSEKYADEAKSYVLKYSNNLILNYAISNELFSWGLGKGETSVIAIAKENPKFIAVLDDGKARKCSKLYNIQITGTIGLVLIAKKLGIIKNIKDCIFQLRDSGLYLSNELIEQVLNDNI